MIILSLRDFATKETMKDDTLNESDLEFLIIKFFLRIVNIQQTKAL